MTHRGYTLTHLVLGLAAIAVIATAIVVTAQRIGKEPVPAANVNAVVNTNARVNVNTPTNRTVGTGTDCATYTTVDGSVEYCATCGNGTCEAAEAGKSSACARQDERVVCTADLGPLYCPQDCSPTLNGDTNTATGQAAGWETYTNTEHSYTFSYPSDWVMSEQQDALNPIEGSSDADFVEASYITDPNGGYPEVTFQVRAYMINPAATLRDIAALDEDLGTGDPTFVRTVTDTFVDLAFAGRPALRYVIDSANNPDGTERAYIQETLFRNGDTVFDIEVITGSPEQFSGWETTIDEMLSSFQFTN